MFITDFIDYYVHNTVKNKCFILKHVAIKKPNMIFDGCIFKFSNISGSHIGTVRFINCHFGDCDGTALLNSTDQLTRCTAFNTPFIQRNNVVKLEIVK